MMNQDQIRLFDLDPSSDSIGSRIASWLDMSMTPHEARRFDDGEVYIKSLENVRGCDVFVIASLHSDRCEPKLSAGEKLFTLYVFISSLLDASARSVTAVIPYMPYARQDRKTESRAPLTLKYVARLLETSGVSRVLTMDVHNVAAFQSAFRIPTDVLEARNLFAHDVQVACGDQQIDVDRITVLSPDAGGVSRANRLRDAIGNLIGVTPPVVYFNKERDAQGNPSGQIVGNVKDRVVVIVDDMIATGSTMAMAANEVIAQGGRLLAACATHGLFIGSPWPLGTLPIMVADTVPLHHHHGYTNRRIVSTHEMFGRAISRTIRGGSISDLLV